MAKASKLKQTFVTAAAAVIIFLLAIGCLNGTIWAKAESERFEDYPTKAVTLTNSQFSDTGSGTPAAPSDWTEEGTKGGVIAGVADLNPTAYSANAKKYELDDYKEYSGSVYPQTPFGGEKYPGTNTNVLMVNTTVGSKTATVFGYTSSTFTLEANRFYSISVYVKTGDFAQTTGAMIRVNGVDSGKGEENELAFHTIDTSDTPADKENDYGFRKYTFYLATSYKTSTASLTLSVGSYRLDEENEINYRYPASGYAFFDNVEINELSPMIYLHHTADNNDPYTMVRDLNAVKTPMYDGHTNLLSSDFAAVDDPELISGNAHSFVYTAVTTNPPEKDQPHNFSADPVSPVGKSGDSNIFCISSFNSEKDKYEDAAAGFKTKKTFTLKRNGYARFSVWAKTQDVEGGAGAVIKLNTDTHVKNGSTDGKPTANTVSVTTAAGPEARYGWTEYAIYAKGSAVQDLEVYLELWLGAKGSESKGIAMFWGLSYEEISHTEYTDNSGSGTAVTFDRTFTDTGVTNGLFFEAGDYDEYKYPLAPSGWTYHTPDTVTTNGFSTEAVDGAEDVIKGIVPTDEEHYEANWKNYGGINANPNPNPNVEDYTNLLLIHSPDGVQTAAGYASSSLTLTASTNYTLTVNLRTYRIDGYGANLVLKDGDNNLLATIENIQNDNFADYTFYIENGAAEKTVTVEVWLGLSDRKNNTQKLASGAVFVSKASLTSVAADDETAAAAFTESMARFDKTITATSAANRSLDFAAYSFKDETFNAYDIYDPSTVKTPYNWKKTAGGDDVIFGIIETRGVPAEQSELPDGFKTDTASDNVGLLYLRNVSAGYSRVEWNGKFSLTEGTFYKLTVRMKTDIPEFYQKNGTAIGAGVELVGAEGKFENILSTAMVQEETANTEYSIDNEYYREYTFYIHAEAANTVGLAFTLGGNEFTNRHCGGRIYVTDIDCQEIGNVDYDMQVKAIDDYKKDKDEDDPYNKYVVMKASDSAEDGGETDKGEGGDSPSGLEWWQIPTILFAVALLIAIVGFMVRRLMEKRSKRKTTEKTANYDRRLTVNKKQPAAVKKDGETIVPAKDAFDEFDDNASIVKPKKPDAPALPAEDVQTAPAEPAKPDASVTDKFVAPIKPDAYKDEFED